MAGFRFAEARAAIAQHFATQWANRTLVEWPNDPLDNNFGRPWVRFALEWSQGLRISLGKPALHRIPGLVTIQVFTPDGTGDGFNTELADDAAAIFGGVNLDAGGLIRFQTPDIVTIANDGGGAWWQQNVQCPFTRDVLV